MSGAGFFDNVGRTRRRGGEAGLAYVAERYRWKLGYAYVDARFRQGLSIVAEDNSSADDDGFIAVESGDRIPSIPRHSVKLTGEATLFGALTLGAQVRAFSDQFVRGNENNEHHATEQGEGFLGPGTSAGYVVVDIDARYRFAGGWELFVKLINLFDRNYATSGVLGTNPFDEQGAFVAEPDQWARQTFYGPGAPRAVWAGIRYAYGGRSGAAD